jgi:signal transduction histidine kinase
MHLSLRAKYWTAGLAGLVLLQTAGSLYLPHGFALSVLSDIIQLLLLLSATLSCLPSAFRNNGRTRLFWALMGFGLASWSTYQAFWVYFEVIKNQEVPNLFTGDAILFLHIVPMMAALALQPNLEQHDRDQRLGSLDFALLLLWWLYLYVYAVIPWQYVYASESAYNLNLKASYSTEQIAFVIALALLWSRSSGLWRSVYAQWFGASFLYSLSSYIANSAIAGNKYYSGSLYDLPLVVSMAWMAVPGLLALNAPSQPAKSARSLPRGVWAARLGMIAVLSLPIFACVSIFDTGIPEGVRTFRVVLTLVAMMLMGAMVFLKQHLLDFELMRLLRSSRRSFEELQHLQTQLVQSEKLASLGQLVGGAAHELNNPLTAMLGYSELLGTTELSPEQRALSDKISMQAKRIRALVASLLSFAKQVPSSKSSLDLNIILQTALKLCQPQMQAAKVQSSIEVAEPPPIVRGDSNQLLQVFSHIISNAVNAMSTAGGALKVRTKAESNRVIVEFSDSGPGMLEPERVFDPFYTTRPVGQGSGLGLSACYGIIQEHGGKIECRNKEEGGAIFTIELPTVQPKKTQAESQVKDQAQAQTAK